MKFIFSLLLLFYFQKSLPSEQVILFKNNREGKSRYFTFWNEFWLKKKNIEIDENFFSDFPKQDQLCEENYIINFNNKLNLESKDNKYATLSLREKNLIDDISTGLILNYQNTPTSVDLGNIDENKLKKIKNISHDEFLAGLKQFSTYQRKKQCLGESFIQLYSSLTKSYLKESKKINSTKKLDKIFKKIIKKLYRHKIINKQAGKDLISLLNNNIHHNKNSLKKYFQNKSFIEKNLKVENIEDLRKNGTSDFVSKKDKINKIFPRQRLYEQFNSFQIIYMSQILEKFLYRLETTAILGINLIDENNETVETIYIESPMEIYRFLVKYMRHEMKLLKENHLFSNSQVLYSDLIAASFEMYQIPPSSLEELMKMEEIWNPQKSKNEKILFWGKIFSQTGILFVPPPFNYLATLSIWVIESFINNKKQDASFDHSIFGDVQ